MGWSLLPKQSLFSRGHPILCSVRRGRLTRCALHPHSRPSVTRCNISRPGRCHSAAALSHRLLGGARAPLLSRRRLLARPHGSFADVVDRVARADASPSHVGGRSLCSAARGPAKVGTPHARSTVPGSTTGRATPLPAARTVTSGCTVVRRGTRSRSRSPRRSSLRAKRPIRTARQGRSLGRCTAAGGRCTQCWTRLRGSAVAAARIPAGGRHDR